MTRDERVRAIAQELTKLPGVKGVTIFVSERQGHMQQTHIHTVPPESFPAIPPDAQGVKVRCKLPPATQPPTWDSLKPPLEAAGAKEFDITPEDDGSYTVEVNVSWE